MHRKPSEIVSWRLFFFFAAFPPQQLSWSFSPDLLPLESPEGLSSLSLDPSGPDGKASLLQTYTFLVLCLNHCYNHEFDFRCGVWSGDMFDLFPVIPDTPRGSCTSRFISVHPNGGGKMGVGQTLEVATPKPDFDMKRPHGI